MLKIPKYIPSAPPKHSRVQRMASVYNKKVNTIKQGITQRTSPAVRKGVRTATKSFVTLTATGTPPMAAVPIAAVAGLKSGVARYVRNKTGLPIIGNKSQSQRAALLRYTASALKSPTTTGQQFAAMQKLSNQHPLTPPLT